MKKINIDINYDYVMGHLRYGHSAGTVELTDEEFERFVKNPHKFITETDLVSELEFILDDYEVDGIGDISSIEYERIYK